MIGILMLDTAFPRLLGDVGNPGSFDVPVRYSIVPGATPEAIVLGDVTPWVEAFVAAGQALVADGCTGLTTTCGFLTPLRAEVEAACGVPVVSSSLELIPGLLAQGARPGILTISAASLSARHLSAAGVPFDIPVHGVEGGHFATSILGNKPQLDAAICEAEMVEGSQRLCALAPAIDVIVLECTNMPPYKRAIEDATGVPVVSILTAVNAMQAQLRAATKHPRHADQPGMP